MTEFLLTLHLVLAIFTIGPLVHAATTATRGIRTADIAAMSSAARTLRLYSLVSVLVAGAGLLLMARPLVTDVTAFYDREQGNGRPDAFVYVFRHNHLGESGQVWIWSSLVLWVLTIILVLGQLVPTLQRAATTIEAGGSAGALAPRVVAGGTAIALSYVVITLLMVYRPGRPL